MPDNKFASHVTSRPATGTDKAQIMALLPYLAGFSIPPKRQAEHLWAGDVEMAEAILAGETTSSLIDVAADANGRILGLLVVSLREEMLSHEPPEPTWRP